MYCKNENKESYHCRVCGLIQDFKPWGDDGHTPSFEICGCCGVAFGYQDCTPEYVKKYREKWLNQGYKWANPVEKPLIWSLEKQMENIPTDKLRIYQLINMYLSGKLDAWTFCNEFYYCYDLEIDSKNLSDIENKLFSELSVITGRFTDFEEDLRQYPGTYFSEEQLKKIILEIQEQLNEVTGRS